MSQIKVSGIRGVVSSMGTGASFYCDGSTVVDNLSIEDVTVVPQGGHPIVYGQFSYCNGLNIRNIAWNGSSACTAGIVQLQLSARGDIKVRDLKMNSSPAGANVGLNVQVATTPFSGTTFGTGITLDGVYCAPNYNAAPATFTALVLNPNAATNTLPYIRISNAYLSPTTSGYLVQLLTGITIPDLDVSDSKFANLTALISAPSSTQPITARLSNISVAGTNLAVVSCPLTLDLSNVDVNTSGAVVAVTGANATPVRVLASNYTQAGAGAGMSRDGSQALSVNGASFKVDTAILTPTDQDQAYNSNAASAPFATGSAMYSGSTWRLMGTGAAKTGTATLAAGTVTVADTRITANSVIRVASKTAGGTVGVPYISARTAGTSFTITSTSNTDTSVIQYDIVTY
jgi:hypothetical protein